MEPLTQEQKELAEKNHNLIYGLAYKCGIDIEEFYGVLAIGLCKAAKHYDSNRGAFSTFAYKTMYYEYIKEVQSISGKSIPQYMIIPLDTEALWASQSDNSGDSMTLANIVPDKNVHVEDDVLCEIQYEKFLDSLHGSDREIMEMLKNGLTKAEIANALHMSYQNVRSKVTKIMRRWFYEGRK